MQIKHCNTFAKTLLYAIVPCYINITAVIFLIGPIVLDTVETCGCADSKCYKTDYFVSYTIPPDENNSTEKVHTSVALLILHLRQCYILSCMCIVLVNMYHCLVAGALFSACSHLWKVQCQLDCKSDSYVTSMLQSD